MALWAIGDLQGCHAEFLALLDRIGFDAGRDRLWLTGDLVNRGPASLATLRAVRSLGESAAVVLGNHDLHLLAMAHAPATVSKREPELEEVLDAPDVAELLEWLRRRPLLHREPGIAWTLVHAGLPPQWTLADAAACAREVEHVLSQDPRTLLEGMYGDGPDLWSPDLSGIERLRFTVNCLTRLRYVDRGGRLLLALKGAIRDAPPGAIPWFRHPARASRDEAFVVGHWSALGYLAEPGLRALDTGCVWGGALTAIRLDRDGAEPVSLPCGRPKARG
ncbi:MAG TPA: symmetrical bis(5'-nucleosyl)-tetraphosphatase [Steroidobacteraceae bacterium]|jgi:bis(5'-nucleosyl)-tetraphosphatase (symmetrical)|nr:symmetrical bis(5'-nucleosyl)-tetraphosphatase [Steroidobacteraceae bacterium]